MKAFTQSLLTVPTLGGVKRQTRVSEAQTGQLLGPPRAEARETPLAAPFSLSQNQREAYIPDSCPWQEASQRCCPMNDQPEATMKAKGGRSAPQEVGKESKRSPSLSQPGCPVLVAAPATYLPQCWTQVSHPKRWALAFHRIKYYFWNCLCLCSEPLSFY